MSSRIWIRRAYDPPSIVDGSRVLVDRLWPRGVSKVELRIDVWARDLAPTDALRHWFGHDPARWDEFRTRYRDELAAQTGPASAEFADLVDRVRSGRVTLVFGAHDARHNNAVVLREYLREHADVSTKFAASKMRAE
ncbi:MAG: DUF488 domain-containing protein [Ilumatobacteraceae bacterium]